MIRKRNITAEYKLMIISIFCTFLSANINSEITWSMSGRVHSELDWHTIKTENFNIHYHKEIERIAKAGANISEQVIPLLMKQLDLKSIPRINVILTSEDEVMNGFANYTNSTFIWVDQNDAAIWLEDGKWLEQVIAHELQHIVYFNKVKTWIPEPYSLMYGETPSWFVEGIAEYYTEKWRPYRADISHKYHILKNTTSDMDPHHDGYSKIKLLAETYGDSSIVKILSYRTKLKMFKFKKAFKEATKISVGEFNEKWRRTINTYYYGIRAQKETYEDAGIVSKLPISKLDNLTGGFSFTNDSMHIAMIGKDDKNQRYSSLIIASVDTTTTKKKKKNDEEEQEDEKKEKIKFNKTEIDFGKIHPSISWSSDNRYLSYSKYHYVDNGALAWDLSLYDTNLKKQSWITNNMRASYPIFKGNNEVIFVSHNNSTSNLFRINIENFEIKQITNFDGDVQIISPSILKDGNLLSFSMSNDSQNLDLYTMDLTSGKIERKTFHEAVDYLPLIDKDSSIVFTSHRSGVPNLFKLDKNNNIQQCTDLSDGIWGVQWSPIDEMILANTLNDVDSSRVIKVDPSRAVIPSELSMNNQFSSWKDFSPSIKFDIKDFDREKYSYESAIEKYSPVKNIKHLTSLLLPLPYPIFNTNWSDALMRNIVSISLGSYTYNLTDVREDWPAEFFVLSYLNALHGPLFGINYFFNSNYSARFYNKSQLLERKDGMQLWMNFPYNAGNSLNSNHSLNFEFISANRTPLIFYNTIEVDETDIPDKFDAIPAPKRGWDNVLAMHYRYLNRRPHKDNYYLPSQGYGIESRIEFGNRPEKLYYQKYSLDSFLNYKIFGFILYSRLKLESTQGNPFPQDRIWFSTDSPIYISGTRGTAIFGENLSPRGWGGDPIIGNNMLFNTIEIRQSLPIEIPIEAFGNKPGKISVAIFQDYGTIINTSSYSPIQTLGYEAKICILNLNTPILFLSYGEAQTLDSWKLSNNPNRYIQVSLVNPF